MLLECENCGAPLDIQEGATTSRCHYCGKTAQVAALKTVADVTPRGWTPPTHWTPPAHKNLPPIPLAFRPARVIGRLVSLSISLAVFGVLAGVAVPILVNMKRSALTTLGSSSQVQNALGQALGAIQGAVNQAGVPTVPLSCTGNEQITLNGQTLSLPTGIPVVASDNCGLRLVGCTVVGSVAISARGNARVTIEGGSVRGTGPAITAAGNAAIDASGGATLDGEATITASENATVTLRGASVSGRHVAIHTSGNASVNASGGTVRGLVAGTRRVVR